MKKFSRALTLMLAAALALSACGGSAGENSDTTAPAGTDTEPVETEPSRENTPDSLPKDLDFGGKTVRISNRGQYDYITFEMHAGEETGDIVNDALYDRDRRVEERLNVTIEYLVGDSDATKYMDNVRTTILAGDDAYDAVIGVQWKILPQTREGLYHDLADAPYLDYSQPWWNNNYMDTVSVSSDTRYVLAGDISLNMLRNLSCMFYNKKLYENLYSDPDGLYEPVLEGKWTHEMLRKMVTDGFQDLNADGIADEGDVVGMVATKITQVDHFVFTSGLKLSERDADGYPMLSADQSRNVTVMETVDKLYWQTEGSLIYSSDSVQFTDMTQKYLEGTSLFIAGRLMNADYLRDMKDPYGIVPMPKLDEAQKDYIGLVHDATPLYGIPVTKTDIEMPCAVLEAMAAQNYRTVTPVYYEVALKVKYAHDEESGQVIDIIHAGMMTDFVYANNGSMGGTNLGTIGRSILSSSGGNYMSTYDGKKSAAEAAIADMIAAAKEE